MARPRLLVLVTYGFSVRYLVPTGLLDRLAQHCEPVVALGWQDPELEAELAALGIAVVHLPDAELSHRYRMHRRRLAVVHERRLATPASRTQRRTRLRWRDDPRVWAMTSARHRADQLLTWLPGGSDRVESREAQLFATGTNVARFEQLLIGHRIDAVLSLTPYHDQDALGLWAARRLGRPSITSVISFDNPTTRARMVVRSERVLVWNHHNAEQVLRSYPDLTADRVRVTGAPQFDLHRRPALVAPEPEWRHRLGLPSTGRVLLYGAGPGELVPGESELVVLIDRAIDEGRLPGDLHLLVRRHPNDPPEPWQRLGRRLRRSTVVDPWAPGTTPFRGWPTHDDLVVQMSTLAHSAAHVNVCSSMSLDGAMFDRPQIGPMFVPGQSRDVQAQVRAFYDQEHWRPIAASGGVSTAGDETQLLAQVRDALEHPGRRAAGRRRMLDEVLTFDDGASSERVAAEVADLLDLRSPEAPTGNQPP